MQCTCTELTTRAQTRAKRRKGLRSLCGPQKTTAPSTTMSEQDAGQGLVPSDHL